MKKRDSKVKLNMKKSHSDALLKNMLYSLLKYGKVETTSSKAKTLKRYADSELSYVSVLESDRLKNSIAQRVGNSKSGELLLHYREYIRDNGIEIPGGHVKIMKTRFRDGDNAEMLEVSLLEEEGFVAFSTKKFEDQVKRKKKVKPAKAKKSKPKAKKDAAEDKKKDVKKEEEKTGPQSKSKKPKIEGKDEGFITGLRGRILGRKVQNQGAGKQDRSTARSGI